MNPEIFAQVLSLGLNALGLLAAPKAWSEATRGGAREDLRAGLIASLEQVRSTIELLDGGASDAEPIPFLTGPVDVAALSPHLTELTARMQTWTSGPPSDELVARARACLELLGAPEPETGWDTFAPDDL
jgi:hypothetical protein